MVSFLLECALSHIRGDVQSGVVDLLPVVPHAITWFLLPPPGLILKPSEISIPPRMEEAGPPLRTGYLLTRVKMDGLESPVIPVSLY